ncbi:MAG: hypothetical protein K8T90_13335 [Planctomycetes bacterium]|nr:hypothetical protein [Planctomycetota bacterium]
MTAITDYLLALLALAWSALLFRRSRVSGGRAVVLWAVAFAAIAVATASAGVYHSVESSAAPRTLAALWHVVVVATSASGLAMTCAAAVSTSSLRRTLYVAAAVVVFSGFVLWGLADDDFVRVAMSTATALAAVLAFQAVAWFRDRAASAVWIAGGVAVSVGAVAAQRLRLGLNGAFDHNATYHVLQTGGLFLLYRGGAMLRPARGGAAAGPLGDGNRGGGDAGDVQ